MYPEINESGADKEGDIGRLKSHPGLRNVIEIGNGPNRGLFIDPLEQVFAVSGNTAYKLSFSGSSWSSSSLGSLSTSTGTVKADSNLINETDTVTVFVDGSSENYIFRDLAGTEDFATFTTRGYSPVDGATHVLFLDGFFVYIAGNKFYTSEWGGFGSTPLDFVMAEGDPDQLKALLKVNRQLWLFGTKTIEPFVNVGNPDFPFERAGVMQKGIIAPYSAAEAEGTVFWLGGDHSGSGIVYAAQGLSYQRISTHPLEAAISSYEVDSIATADGFTYSHDGHVFYQLNFPEATWVYDLTTKEWHEKAYNNLGTLERDRANYHVYVPSLNVHLFADYESNVIYELDGSMFKHDEVPMRRIRSSPIISEDGKEITYDSFEIDCERGVGLDGSVQGSDPQAILKISKDGGHTFGNEMWASIGAIGNRKPRAKWNRLGSAREMVAWVEVADPVNVVMSGARINPRVGNS